MRIGGYGASQRIEGRADGMHPGSLSSVRLYPSLPCHVLVISLLATLMVVPRCRGGHLVTLVTLLTLMSLMILMILIGRSRQQVFHHIRRRFLVGATYSGM